MLGVRFHGRGGHGVKTASRIVGTAAFLSGYQAQDSPVYGAERRGAAVTAFARIYSAPILERGVIERPDLILVGDETLLADPIAGVLAGQESASALFVNAADTGGLREKLGIVPPLVTVDVTEITQRILGKVSALSAGLAAAAARLVGCVSAERLEEAVREELASLHVPDEAIDKNVRLAAEVFGRIAPVPIERREVPSTGVMHEVGYDYPLIGSPTIVATANAAARKTGNWRVERPEIDYDLCTRCGLCFIRCPDGAIALDEEGYPVIDYDHCKGCMICAHSCPVDGILRKREVRAW